MKNFFRTELWKWIRTVIEIVMIGIVMIMMFNLVRNYLTRFDLGDHPKPPVYVWRDD